jgi:hypothetical protein
MEIQPIVPKFSDEVNKLYQAHLPSNHPFFEKLASFPRDQFHATLPHSKFSQKNILGELHFRYQAACHATRVMVYHVPHLDSPELRVRKLQIIMDDDKDKKNDIHHYQLNHVFANIGADIVGDEIFGDLTKLQAYSQAKHDLETAQFVSLVQKLYPHSLGAWCVIETFADDWMHAWMKSLSKSFPTVEKEPYFADCFADGVEERHAQEALSLTDEVLVSSPELWEATMEDARQMAEGLDQLWSSMENLLENVDSLLN